jgi:hypothetical protein
MTTHGQSEQFEKGMSRRGLVQALAIGAAGSSFSTPAAAQQTAVLAEATVPSGMWLEFRSAVSGT